jgi:hypothetical protein
MGGMDMKDKKGIFTDGRITRREFMGSSAAAAGGYGADFVPCYTSGR